MLIKKIKSYSFELSLSEALTPAYSTAFSVDATNRFLFAATLFRWIEG
jgi:hypothetical protein